MDLFLSYLQIELYGRAWQVHAPGGGIVDVVDMWMWWWWWPQSNRGVFGSRVRPTRRLLPVHGLAFSSGASSPPKVANTPQGFTEAYFRGTTFRFKPFGRTAISLPVCTRSSGSMLSAATASEGARVPRFMESVSAVAEAVPSSKEQMLRQLMRMAPC